MDDIIKENKDLSMLAESVIIMVLDALEHSITRLLDLPIRDYDIANPAMETLMYCHDELTSLTNSHIPYKKPEKKATDTSDIPW